MRLYNLIHNVITAKPKVTESDVITLYAILSSGTEDLDNDWELIFEQSRIVNGKEWMVELSLLVIGWSCLCH